MKFIVTEHRSLIHVGQIAKLEKTEILNRSSHPTVSTQYICAHLHSGESKEIIRKLGADTDETLHKQWNTLMDFLDDPDHNWLNFSNQSLAEFKR